MGDSISFLLGVRLDNFLENEDSDQLLLVRSSIGIERDLVELRKRDFAQRKGSLMQLSSRVICRRSPVESAGLLLKVCVLPIVMAILT